MSFWSDENSENNDCSFSTLTTTTTSTTTSSTTSTSTTTTTTTITTTTVYKLCLPIANSTYSDIYQAFAYTKLFITQEFNNDFDQMYWLLSNSAAPVYATPLHLQSIIIKFASDTLIMLNASATLDSYYTANISSLYPLACSNPDFSSLLNIDFLTCLTSHIQSVWPESNLTASTTDIINCQPVFPTTILEFQTVVNSILNTDYITYFPVKGFLQGALNTLFSGANGDPTSIKVFALQNLKNQIINLSKNIANWAPRDFNTSFSALVDIYNSALSSEIRTDLLDMTVSDFLACILGETPWSANNT
jgi:hypothetical protein